LLSHGQRYTLRQSLVRLRQEAGRRGWKWAFGAAWTQRARLLADSERSRFARVMLLLASPSQPMRSCAVAIWLYGFMVQISPPPAWSSKAANLPYDTSTECHAPCWPCCCCCCRVQEDGSHPARTAPPKPYALGPLQTPSAYHAPKHHRRRL
jgi:hypothetical protein